MFCLFILKSFENNFNVLLVSCSHFRVHDSGLPSYFKLCLKNKNSLMLTFNKHLVKKGVLNMSHRHITKVQQKEKEVSLIWDYLSDMTVFPA